MRCLCKSSPSRANRLADPMPCRTWFTFGMANAQWIFLNWGQQFINWKKTTLALFNWFMILGKLSLSWTEKLR